MRLEVIRLYQAEVFRKIRGEIREVWPNHIWTKVKGVQEAYLNEQSAMVVRVKGSIESLSELKMMPSPPLVIDPKHLLVVSEADNPWLLAGRTSPSVITRYESNKTTVNYAAQKAIDSASRAESHETLITVIVLTCAAVIGLVVSIIGAQVVITKLQQPKIIVQEDAQGNQIPLPGSQTQPLLPGAN